MDKGLPIIASHAAGSMEVFKNKKPGRYLPRKSWRLNRLAIDNGFTGTGEIADLLCLYVYDLHQAEARDPVEFLNLVMKAKKLKEKIIA
jgi:hypothetical protein